MLIRFFVIFAVLGSSLASLGQDKSPGVVTLSGVTRDLTGVVVPDASIRLLDNKGKTVQELKSDSSGSFFSATAPAKMNVIEVEAYGYYPPYRQNVSFSAGTRVTLDIWMTGPLTNPVTAAIEGEVIDEQKRPIAHAQVLINYYGRFDSPIAVKTDSKGHFFTTLGYVGQTVAEAHADGFENSSLVFIPSRDLPSKENALQLVLKRKTQ